MPELPLPLRDTVHVPPTTRHVGHSGAGWALGLHALGVPVHLVDLIGDDLEGEHVRAALASRGVRLTALPTDRGTKRSVNLVGPDGARTSLYDGRDQGRPELAAGLVTGLLAGVRHVHVTINDWTRPVLRAASARGLPLSTDLHDWDGRSEHHREFAALADLVVMSAAARRDEDPETVCRSVLASGRARVVVLTAGAAGAWVLVRDGGTVTHVPAVRLPDRPVVDTNGAGDAFGAAMLAGLLDGLGAVAAARRAAAAAAWACGSPGTQTDPVTPQRLDALTERSTPATPAWPARGTTAPRWP